MSWRMDETYIKIKGEWHYLYRAVDKEGDTVDFMLSKKRDEAAAKAFFTKSIGSSGIPEKVTIDKSGANLAGLNAINFQIAILTLLEFSVMQIKIRQIKYLNNIIEQDHRGINKDHKSHDGFQSLSTSRSDISRH